MGDPDFLKHAWAEMCAVYRDAPLAKACIEMQSSLGVDVPLLLLLCLADRAGHVLDAASVRRLETAGTAWREAAILPLRQARTAMKGLCEAPAETALRRSIKALELEAERLHAARLAAHFPPSGDGASRAALTYLTMRGATPAAAAEFIAIFDRAHGACIRPGRPAADSTQRN